MSEVQDEPLPRWRTTRWFSMAAVALGVLVLATASLFIRNERDTIATEMQISAALYAHVIEQQTASILDGLISSQPALLDDVLDAWPDAGNLAYSQTLSANLEAGIRSRPVVHQVFVMDSGGMVLASSSMQKASVRLDPSLFGSLPVPGSKAKPGPLLVGRDLEGLGPYETGKQGLVVLPVITATKIGGGQSIYIVELLNLDFLASRFEITANATPFEIGLASYGGTLLASTANLKLDPGANLGRMDIFSRILPNQEFGQYTGTGMGKRSAIVAFRTLRQWPLVVMVELPQAVLNGRMEQSELSAFIITTCVLVLIASVTVLTLRSLRRHEQLLRDRDLANRLAAEVSARNTAILNSSPDAILTFNASATILTTNAAAQGLFGKPQQEIIGTPLQTLVLLDEWGDAQPTQPVRPLSEIVGPMLNETLERYGSKAGGKLFPVEITIVQLAVHGEQLFTATIRDISLRKRVLSSLRNSELRFRMTFEQAAVGMLQQAFNRRFLRVNDTLCKLLGYTREEFLALDADDLIHPEDVADGLDFMKRLFAGEISTFTQEKRYRQKAGTYIWVRLTASVAREDDGRASYMICVVEDISERRKAQSELTAAREREMAIGTRIQQTLLVAPPAEPDAGLWISAFNQPSKGIDGDFFDIIHVGPDVVDVIVGDVMGKGIPAALLGAATKLQFSRSIAELMTAGAYRTGPPSPRDIVAAVNQAMTPHLQALEAFVTLAYLRINLRANTVVWVGCGHEEALVIRADGTRKLLANQQPPVGLISEDQCLQDAISLDDGDAIFLCSDGAADALLPDGSRVGRDAINAAIAKSMALQRTPAMALHTMRRDVLEGRAALMDDLTMVLLVRTNMRRAVWRLEVPVSLESIKPVREFVEMHARDVGLDEATAGPLTVATVEVLTNIVRHGTGRVTGAPVEILMGRSGTGLTV